MVTAQAGQQIYTHVEKEQSPRGQGGFQTLFYTHSLLSAAEAEEMEGRLLYFPGATEPVKRVFFTTSSGKVVLAQVVSLPEPDRLGRRGRYLAHSLVFTPEEFARLGTDPCGVFRHFAYVATVAEALQLGDAVTGDIPAASLGLQEEPQHAIAAARDWPVAELGKLALLALRAERLARDRAAVVLVGEPAQVERALEAAFSAVPAALRLRCTFDSYFYRCNLVSTYYWAIGLLDPPGRPDLAIVDARSRQVRGPIPAPETAYEHWAAAVLESGDLDTLAHYRNHAFALGELLGDRPYDGVLVEAAPAAVVAAIAQRKSPEVAASLRRRLEEKLPDVLAGRALEAIQRSDPLALLRQLRAGFTLPQLQDALYEAYQDAGFSPPPREELRALEKLLRQTDHRLLRLLLAGWAGQHDALRRGLRQLAPEEYARFVQAALAAGLVDPLLLIIPGRGEPFLDLYLASGAAEPGRLVPLVEALLAAGEAPALARLAPRIAGRPARELRELEKLARRREVPEAFRRAVDEATKGDLA